MKGEHRDIRGNNGGDDADVEADRFDSFDASCCWSRANLPEYAMRERSRLIDARKQPAGESKARMQLRFQEKANKHVSALFLFKPFGLERTPEPESAAREVESGVSKPAAIRPEPVHVGFCGSGAGMPRPGGKHHLRTRIAH